jgi:hypothetical protein
MGRGNAGGGVIVAVSLSGQSLCQRRPRFPVFPLGRHDVKAFCYIDRDWEALPRWRGKGWGDSRIHADDLVKANWLKEISGRRYLKASEGLFASLGFRPAPE